MEAEILQPALEKAQNKLVKLGKILHKLEFQFIQSQKHCLDQFEPYISKEDVLKTIEEMRMCLRG